MSALNTPEIATRANCSAGAKALADSKTTPPEFLNLLEKEGLLHDAILFLSHMMPSSDVIKWALAVVHALQPEGTPIAGQESLKTAEAWVKTPVDPVRWAARDAADKGGMESPSDCIAMAVFMSGGSITPPESPEVSPPEHAANSLCSGAILLTSVLHEPEKMAERQRTAIALGRKQAGLPPSPPLPEPPPTTETGNPNTVQ